VNERRNEHLGKILLNISYWDAVTVSSELNSHYIHVDGVPEGCTSKLSNDELNKLREYLISKEVVDIEEDLFFLKPRIGLYVEEERVWYSV